MMDPSRGGRHDKRWLRIDRLLLLMHARHILASRSSSSEDEELGRLQDRLGKADASRRGGRSHSVRFADKMDQHCFFNFTSPQKSSMSGLMIHCTLLPSLDLILDDLTP